MSLQSKVVVCRTPGDFNSIAIDTVTLRDLGPKDVLIKQAYAPINPADINMMEGRYYVSPEAPFVLGNEGVGQVETVGSAVAGVRAGDSVIIPFKSEQNWVGSYSEYLVANEEDVVVVPSEISLQQASMMTVNPFTAFEMLHHIIDLEPDDMIVQNAASSAVGRWVIFFAATEGLKTINLVRDMSYKEELKDLGADVVAQDMKGAAKLIREKCPHVILGLNGVGGDSGLEVCKSLMQEGIMVTYGAMSKQPVTLSNASLIYKSNAFHGYNRGLSIESQMPDDVRETYDAIFTLYLDDPFDIPVAETFSLDQVKDAINYTQKPSRKGKVLLSF